MIKIFIFDQEQDFIPNFDFGIPEKKRLDSLRNPKRRLESEAALCALSNLISLSDCKVKLEISRDKNGKPYFKDSQISFSLAHSANVSVAAICDEKGCKIGIDVEKIVERPDLSRLAERFFSPHELEQLKDSSFSPDCFFRLWTLKEARSKMSGEGLSAILKNDSLGTELPFFSNCYEFYNKNDKYCLSVCADCDISNIEFYNNSSDIMIKNK